MASYETRINVRFGDIDHAQIVYYPRISHYCHVALEEFYRDEVGTPYHEMLDDKRLGFPAVHSDIDYRESLAFGDVAVVEIVVEKVGTSSIVTRYRIRKEKTGALCVVARVTTVCVDMDTFRPARVPDFLRAVFLAHGLQD